MATYRQGGGKSRVEGYDTTVPQYQAGPIREIAVKGEADALPAAAQRKLQAPETKGNDAATIAPAAVGRAGRSRAAGGPGASQGTAGSAGKPGKGMGGFKPPGPVVDSGMGTFLGPGKGKPKPKPPANPVKATQPPASAKVAYQNTLAQDYSKRGVRTTQDSTRAAAANYAAKVSGKNTPATGLAATTVAKSSMTQPTQGPVAKAAGRKVKGSTMTKKKGY